MASKTRTPDGTARSSRRRWLALLPLGAGVGVVSLFAVGVLPPDGAVPTTTQSRPEAAAVSEQQTPADASPSATASSVPSSPPSSTTRSRAASPSRSDRVQSVPSVARVPVSSPGIKAAARYATSRGYEAGVAVVDTTTGKLWAGGDYDGYFATESVVKVFIATRLLATKRMTGDRADMAYRMIARSDDGAASALYGFAGGDGVVPWIAKHYGISNLGSPPTRPGWWGNTKISAVGMARFYAKVKADPLVWPWLSKAMHRATEYASDGTFQFFGLKQADRNAAIKQGWGQDDDDWGAAADFNSTGYVNSDRYAVAILVKGPPYEYNRGVPNMVTQIAKRLMPGGVMRP